MIFTTTLRIPTPLRHTRTVQTSTNNKARLKHARALASICAVGLAPWDTSCFREAGEAKACDSQISTVMRRWVKKRFTRTDGYDDLNAVLDMVAKVRPVVFFFHEPVDRHSSEQMEYSWMCLLSLWQTAGFTHLTRKYWRG